MKGKLISIIVFISIFCLNRMYGECNYSTYISIFPSEYLIAPNSMFLIEISGDQSDEIIQNLNGKYWVYLTSGGEVVPLILMEKKTGMMIVSQAILKPEKTLKKGLEYTLVIENIRGYVHCIVPFADFKKIESKKKIFTKYKVKAYEDNKKPILQSATYINSRIFHEFGCGDEEFVMFKALVTDESQVLVKATLKSLANNKISSYYLVVKKNIIAVGHDMCLGAFRFDDGNNYEVEFEFFDACGNSTKYEKKLNFEKPQRER